MSPAESAAASLHAALDAGHQAARDLAQAADVLIANYPYDPISFIKLSSSDRMAMDALFHRYVLLSSVFQDRILKSIAIIQQEDPGLGRRDLSELMAKLGVITDADGFNVRVVARNQLAHTYITQLEDQIDRLNETLASAIEFIRDFNTSLDYVVRKSSLPIHPLTGLQHVILELPDQTRTSHPT